MAVVQIVRGDASTGLGDEIVAVSVADLCASIGNFRQYLCVIAVAVHDISSGLAAVRFAGTDAIGVEAESNCCARRLCFGQAVGAVVAVPGHHTCIRFGQGVAIGIVGEPDSTLGGQAIVVVVGVAGVHTINDAVGPVSNLVMLVFGTGKKGDGPHFH